MKYANTYQGILSGVFESGSIMIFEDGDVAPFFPARREDLNKGDCGSAVILAGSGSLGAPILSVGACLKSGAGYTRLLLPPLGSIEADEMRRTVISARYPACIVGTYTGEKISSQSLVFGMGAGVGAQQWETLRTLLSGYTGTLILDADAINLFEAYGRDALRRRNCPVVLTPHPKEFSRLTGRSLYEILSDPVSYARAFAEEYGVIVVLKSHRTVITDGVRVAVNRTGSPALAKGGSGDALAGFLTGTIARGLAPFEAAVAACYVFGCAGEIAAYDLGEYSPDATDVIARLPKAIKSIL